MGMKTLLHQTSEVIKMKGYQPDLTCKKQLEVFNQSSEQLTLELGIANVEKCDCEDGECKYSNMQKDGC